MRPVLLPSPHALTHLVRKGNASKYLRIKRISLRHLQLAIRGDEELDMLVHLTIVGGGVFVVYSYDLNCWRG